MLTCGTSSVESERSEPRGLPMNELDAIARLVPGDAVEVAMSRLQHLQNELDVVALRLATKAMELDAGARLAGTWFKDDRRPLGHTSRRLDLTCDRLVTCRDLIPSLLAGAPLWALHEAAHLAGRILREGLANLKDSDRESMPRPRTQPRRMQPVHFKLRLRKPASIRWSRAALFHALARRCCGSTKRSTST